ncbi:MAG TPA: MOSC domain-containing protein [Thermoplasmata archaeon]|nr:MOSC domain-containing protein [Thermoplasmata archaeon]
MTPNVPVAGRVFELHRKAKVEGEHGLPKPTVPEAFISRTGLTGDFNRYRHEEKGDDPMMALLIVPHETLSQLGREGWPVRSGDLGENITSEGIPYDAFVPGRKFAVGEAEVEISKACTPCDNLYLLPYVGPARGPEFLKVMLNRRGWYARVLREGRVHTGDPLRALE